MSTKDELNAALDAAQALIDEAKEENRSVDADAYAAAVAKAEAIDAELRSAEKVADKSESAAELRSRYASVINATAPVAEESELRSLISGETRAAVTLPTAYKNMGPVESNALSLVNTGAVDAIGVIPVPNHAGSWPVGSWSTTGFTDTAEAAAATEDGSRVNATLTTGKGTSYKEISFEMLDRVPAVEATLRNKFARDAGKYINAKTAAAIIAGGTDVTSAASTSVDAAFVGELLELPYEIDADDRVEGFYVVSTDAMKNIRSFRNSGGELDLAPLSNGTMGLGGYPVYELGLNDVGTGNTSVSFVIPEAVVIGASDFSVNRNDSVGFLNEVATFLASIHAGAVVAEAAGVQNLVFA